MSNTKPKIYNPNNLIKAIEKWPNPIRDLKHGYDIYIEGRARSNQTRVEHIIQYRHDLKVRDIEVIPYGISHYFEYKKDPIYKNTYNYYIKRGGNDTGLIKVSIRISDKDPKHAWIKTIYITYKIK